jgi:Arc/MetJ-type ribon-helix-helix transcriptional regulator
MPSPTSRAQLNVRVSDALGQAIDKKRIDLSAKLGTIPSRSDVVRFALEAYLSIDLSESEADARKASSKKKKRQ